MLGDLNEAAVALEEAGEGGEVVSEAKSGGALGLYGFLVACFGMGGVAVLEWLVVLLNLGIVVGAVPVDWRGAALQGEGWQVWV